MDTDKMLRLQLQVRQNNDEMVDFINDLNSWEDEIKIKEKSLKVDKPASKSLPPPRNKIIKKPVKNEETEDASNNKRIKSWDYKAWDKFDANEECKVLDEKPQEEELLYEDEDDIMMRVERFKEEGNRLFKLERYMKAVGAYSQGLFIDPCSSTLLSNRAMAYIKLEKYELAESDCTKAIVSDPRSVKAFMRRGWIRQSLKKYKEARQDFLEALNLEPKNKFSKKSLDDVIKIMAAEESSKKMQEGSDALVSEKGVVKPIFKPVKERSKKPLRRIIIEETGINALPSLEVSSKEDESFKKFLDKVPKQDSNTLETSKELCASVEMHEATVESPASSIPPAPSNSYQFQKDWKILKSEDVKFARYFKGINPTTYKQVFGEAFDSDVLSKIISILHQNPSDLDSSGVLRHLTNVKRFSVIVGFLSPTDKQRLQDIFESPSVSKTDDVNILRSMYK